MGRYKFLLILTLVILVALSGVIWFYPSSEDFRDENPFWNGIKTFTREIDASSLSSLDGLPETSKETALIIIPQLEFTQSEMEKLDNYLSLGGTLLILDDFGYGNDILEYLGLEIRFNQYPLLDPLFNYKNKWLPEITGFAPAYQSEDINSIVLNHAASLSDVTEANVIAWSSRFSYSDLNDNSTWDEGEPKGLLPVAATLEVGTGQLVLIADPSILINGMEGISDNHIFVENLIQIKSPDPDILVDQSHIEKASLDDAKAMLTAIRNRLASPMGVSILVCFALIITLSPIWAKKTRFFNKEE